jgi:hypothetical protein
MAPVDYAARCILVRDRKSGTFEDDRVGSCLVVGAVAEASLRLAYRPEADCLPFPLALQTAALFPSVSLRDVLLQGETRASKTLEVKVKAKDADLALAVVRSAVSKLQHGPYNLEVMTVDHTGGSSCLSAHDLLMTPRLGVASCLAAGLYSIELRCREVVDKKAFDWEGVLTKEALPLLTAEQQKKRKRTEPLLRSRILVFACFPCPCHSAPESLHASITYGSGWERLWGWSGFRPLALPSTRPMPQVKAKAKAQPRPAAATAATRPATAPSVLWERLLAKQGMEGTWVKLADFCRHLKLPRNKAKRDYLEGPTAWRVASRSGGKLRYPEDWSERPGNRGGIPPIFVRREKLEEVFLKYFAKA